MDCFSFNEMSRKYKFHNPSAAYFVSFATVYWIDVFTRELYLNILVKSVAFCRKHKGMELFAYCFMPSHVHLIFRAINENPTELLRAILQKLSLKQFHKMFKKVERNGCYGCLRTLRGGREM